MPKFFAVRNSASPAGSVLRGQRIAVASQFAAMGCTTGSWASRIPGVRAQVGLDDTHWGLALTSATLGSLLSMVVVLTMVGRLRPRRMALAGVGLLLTDAPLLASSGNATQLVIGLLLQGVATGLLAPSMNAQAVEVERRYRRRIMSTFHACFSFGQLIGGVAGTVGARLSVPPGWQLAGSSVVLAGLLVSQLRRLPPDIPVAPAATRAARIPLRRRFTPQLLLLAGIALLASIIEGSSVQWSAQYTADGLAAGAGLGAATFTAFSIAMTISRAYGDRLVNRLGQRLFLRVSELTVAVGLSAGLMIGTPVAAIVAFALVGAGSACMIPTLMGMAGAQPGIATAQGVSVVSIGQWPAFLIGPPLVGAIAGVVGLRWALLLLVVAAVLIVLAVQGVRQPAPDERALPGRANEPEDATASFP